MVLRQEVNAQPNVRDTRQINSAQVQDANVRPNTTVQVGDQSWRTNLLDSIAGTAFKLADKAMGVAQENAYLEGQIAASTGKAEEELDTNIFTKDWAVAGHRDTLGKIALADSESQLALDMQELRTKSPSEMQAYLNARREKLTPLMSSMSREQRQAIFGQMVVSDRAAMSKHTSEHTKYVIDTRAKANQALLLPALTELAETRKAAATGNASPSEYNTSLQKVAGVVYNGILNDPVLAKAPDIQKKMVVSVLEQAMASDDVNLYQALRDNPLPGSTDGRSALSMLDEDDLVKLGKQYRETMQRTVAQRNTMAITVKASDEAQMANGTFKGTFSEVQSKANQWLTEGVIDKGGYESYLQQFFTHQSKFEDMEALADAAIRNDVQFMTGRNKSQAQAYDALDAKWAKAAQNGQPVPLHAQVGALLMGVNNGSTEAAKRMGVRVGPAIMQLARADGTLDQQHAQVLATANAAYEKATEAGFAPRILEGMTDEQQTRFLSLREHMRAGKSADEALKAVLGAEQRNAGLTPSQKAAITEAKGKEITAALQKVDGIGVFRSIGLHISSMWNPTDAARLQISPRENWFSNNTVVGDYVAKTRAELAQEMNALSLTSPYLSADALLEKASAQVAQRTIKTEHGPMILPRGSNAAAFFGVPGSVDNDTIGTALNNVLKVKDGNRMAFEVAQGAVIFREYDRDGNPTSNGGRLDPKSVQGAVKELLDKRTQQRSEVYGTGRTVVKDGVQITFNGENSAGVSSDLMFKFRANLVNNEGVRNTVYKDTLNNPTVGVGIANKAYWPKINPDGRVDRSEIERTFRVASNDAVVAGARAAQATGLQGDNWTLMLSELAYQSGTSFHKLSKYQSFFNAAKSGDKAATIEAFKQTKAYEVSGESRRKHYLSLIDNAMKG